ncbi:hypothetical protein Y032_0138g2078 [Ancylostoma ceylanicum]|uniref:Intraflagellar transport protein 57 homolog n=1 Tax=Ancylostoma ceylanicum TaxID=53326 RepID=A0A016T4W0_9BILA|nr:hypothetical protein Y032_0138g2078 [Ancylostoma ceylanicum]
MEENEEKEEHEHGDFPEGPGKLFEPYIKNEDLVDKLKLLNYEDGFLKMNTAFKPVQRHYFVNSRNVGEQFFMFTSLAAWLIRKGGNESYEMPQEFDDPNATIAGIMGHLRANVSASSLSI